MKRKKGEIKKCQFCGYVYDPSKVKKGTPISVEDGTHGFCHVEFSEEELKETEVYWMQGTYVRYDEIQLCPRCWKLQTDNITKVTKDM